MVNVQVHSALTKAYALLGRLDSAEACEASIVMPSQMGPGVKPLQANCSSPSLPCEHAWSLSAPGLAALSSMYFSASEAAQLMLFISGLCSALVKLVGHLQATIHDGLYPLQKFKMHATPNRRCYSCWHATGCGVTLSCQMQVAEH